MDRVLGRPKNGASTDSGEYWLSVSDLMAGLMVVFLFIAISLMRDAFSERDKIKEVAVTYQENQVAIYNALMSEFSKDLARWGAEIEKDSLSFRFKSPDVLFDRGDITLKPTFKIILDDFFRRYLSVLDHFHDSVDEVRIEGHTSSIWSHKSTPDEAYFKNMVLSQGRTRSVLEYVYQLAPDEQQRAWVKSTVAAVGFSSSRAVLDENGKEDMQRSRRVVFRVITNAETQIRKILDL